MLLSVSLATETRAIRRFFASISFCHRKAITFSGAKASYLARANTEETYSSNTFSMSTSMAPTSDASWTFEKTLAHEKDVTARIHKLYHLAAAEGDTATQVFLQWFVTEQVEEEANADDICKKIRFVGQDGPGMYMIDRELKTRVITPETAGQA